MKIDSFAIILMEIRDKERIPASRLKAKTTRNRFQPLLDSGIVVLERAGAGQRYRLYHPKGLENFIQSQFPNGLEPPALSHTVPRNRAVLYKKDAHGAKSSHLPLFVRGFQGAQLNWNERTLPVADLTVLAGGTGFCLARNSRWSFPGTVVTVENSEVFFHIEKIIPLTGLAIYTGGRISKLLLKWLSSDVMKEAVFIHAGDYDPVGLQDFLRLSMACPGRVTLYEPDNLEVLFARYANHERLEDQSKVLCTLRTCSDDVILKHLKLMDKYNGGVDQEALLSDL
ncbi:MAG: hypothetical protein DRH21_05115 [Deltaproteobacteria bacterium]|nr:MAG: hypothetical protein DRH21_05115 [Deltaproteobacteria bacterium]